MELFQRDGPQWRYLSQQGASDGSSGASTPRPALQLGQEEETIPGAQGSVTLLSDEYLMPEVTRAERKSERTSEAPVESEHIPAAAAVPRRAYITAQLSLANEAMQCLVLRPGIMDQLDELQRSMGDDNSFTRASSLSTLLKVTVRSVSRHRWFVLFSCIALPFVAKRLNPKAKIIGGAFIGTVIASTAAVMSWSARWALTSRSRRPSAFSTACRSIVLLKAAQSTLLEAQIAASRHHVAQRSGAELVYLRQQWLVSALLEDSFFTMSTYTSTPHLMGFAAAPNAPSPADLGVANVSAEELEILIARAQYTLWTCVRYVSLLSPDDSYSPSLSDLFKMLIGLYYLWRHHQSLASLCSRLEGGFAPSSPLQASLMQSNVTGAYQELFTHAQRLSGQLYLLRTASTSANDAEIQQAMRDLGDVIGALAGTWNRMNLSAATSASSLPRSEIYSEDNDENLNILSEREQSLPLRSEMSAQGEDPHLLYPPSAFDEEVGSQRAALPDSFADFLQAMRKGK